MNEPHADHPAPDSSATTHWSVIASVRSGGDSTTHGALAWLCERYWYPLYIYIRHKGHAPTAPPT